MDAKSNRGNLWTGERRIFRRISLFLFSTEIFSSCRDMRLKCFLFLFFFRSIKGRATFSIASFVHNPKYATQSVISGNVVRYWKKEAGKNDGRMHVVMYVSRLMAGPYREKYGFLMQGGKAHGNWIYSRLGDAFACTRKFFLSKLMGSFGDNSENTIEKLQFYFRET